jgi:periplasmic protein TonB
MQMGAPSRLERHQDKTRCRFFYPARPCLEPGIRGKLAISRPLYCRSAIQTLQQMSTLELPWAVLDAPTTWYRQPSVKAAFVLSLLIHAAAIALLPSLRVPVPNVPPPITVELVHEAPPPVVKAEAPPPPVAKAAPKPVPPPLPKVKPAPEPEPPPPVVETRAPPPPPQPIVVPQRPAEPEPHVAAPPRVEAPPPQAHVEPSPPPAPPPRAQSVAPTLDPVILRDYSAVVSSVVAKKKVYPRMALMRHWQGTAELKLQIAPDGNLKTLSVAHSSGFEILDEQAMKMVKDAMPLPVLPEALRGHEFAIDIPVAFKLQD